MRRMNLFFSKDVILSIGASFSVAVAVVLGLQFENIEITKPQAVIRPIMAIGIIGILSVLVCKLIYAPLIGLIPTGLYLFFMYSSIREFVPDSVAHRGIITSIFLLFVTLILFFYFRRQKDELVSLSSLFVFTCIATISGIYISISLLVENDAVEKTSLNLDNTLAPVPMQELLAPAYPDILYVVPDRYASSATLLSEFGYDNGKFYDDLRKRGFSVVENAWANYPSTFQSLASTLNGAYLDPFKATGVSNQQPIYKLIEENAAQDRLRRLGYRFLNFGNWWGPTRRNRHAHSNYDGFLNDSVFAHLSEFETALLRKTPLSTVFDVLRRRNECKRIKRKLDRMRQIGNQSQPVFVFAHMAIPHDPIIFDAAGNCLGTPITYPATDTSWNQFKSAYVEYLKYFNSSIIDIIDEQLRMREADGRKLILVIQSDEGPFPKMMRIKKNDSSFTAFSDRELKMKMGIINAILLPRFSKLSSEDIKTPINNFRIILNEIYGKRNRILPHKSYIYPEMDNIFDFRDISDAIYPP